MRKRLWIGLALFLVIPGLLFTTSCGKRQVKAEPEVAEPVEMETMEEEGMVTEEGLMTEEEEARRRQLEEQRLEEQRRRAMTEREEFINEDIHFDFDRSYIRQSAQEILREKAEYMRKHPEVSVLIEGHTDERGTDEYNLALGERRAESAKQYLVKLGISGTRLETISYGEERPVDPGHNEEAWAKNRRAHFVIQ